MGNKALELMASEQNVEPFDGIKKRIYVGISLEYNAVDNEMYINLTYRFKSGCISLETIKWSTLTKMTLCIMPDTTQQESFAQ